MYCIDADCALTYLMSKAANNLYITSFPVEEDAFDNCGYVPFPNWAYAPDGKIHLISPNEKA